MKKDISFTYFVLKHKQKFNDCIIFKLNIKKNGKYANIQPSLLYGKNHTSLPRNGVAAIPISSAVSMGQSLPTLKLRNLIGNCPVKKLSN